MDTISDKVSITGLIIIIGIFLTVTPVKADEANANSEANSVTRNDKLATKVIFINDSDPSCELKSFSVDNKSITSITKLEICPEEIIVRSEQSSILLITKEAIQEIAFDGETIIKPVLRLPVIEPKYGSPPPHPIDAGYFSDGSLAVVMEDLFPGEDSDGYLYLYKNDNWVLEQKRECPKFVTCDFDSIKLRSSQEYFTKGEMVIWNEKQKANPYLTRSESKRNDRGETIINLYFKFNTEKSTITVKTSEADIGSDLTMGLSLKVGNKEAISLSNEQCETALMGKYLILYRFWDQGIELFDLETGKSILGKLKIAEWMY